MSLQQRFIDNWQQRGLTTDKPILLAVSGGIDSMAMAGLFLQAQLPFAVAHCNFKLRGAEADKDEALVTDWCAYNNIMLHVTSFDTQRVSEESKKGIQETARTLRYEWFDKLLKEHGYKHIATAHHADDNAETLLMNLFKGTGIAGLHGIPPVNGNIIRPLLFAEKEEIRSYVVQNNIPYRDDASNDSDKYTRNNIRLNILPLIKESFPGIINTLSKNIERFAEAELLYNKAVEQERKKLVEKRGKDYYISIKKLLLRSPLQTICFELLAPFGFSSAQVPEVIKLMQSETGQYISSEHYKLINNRGFLIITAINKDETDLILISEIPSVVKTSDKTFHFKFIDNVNKVPDDNNRAYIDANKIALPLVLRRWKRGDYFYPLGMGMKKKKLSRFFIDQKIPVHEKEQVWVLESNQRIIWIAGYRLDERFKITNHTSKVLTVG